MTENAIASPTVTPTMAAHVLHHFGEGGHPAGGFVTALVELITRADPVQRQQLGLAYPGYVMAVTTAQDVRHGIAALRAIANGSDQPTLPEAR